MRGRRRQGPQALSNGVIGERNRDSKQVGALAKSDEVVLEPQGTAEVHSDGFEDSIAKGETAIEGRQA
jgi:hypothetical protein